jgi:hypothetical protein
LLRSERVAVFVQYGIVKDAPIMANRVLASVGKMYNWAFGQDLVENNPCFKLPAPSKERRRDRVLSNEELKKVWTALREHLVLLCQSYMEAGGVIHERDACFLGPLKRRKSSADDAIPCF